MQPVYMECDGDYHVEVLDREVRVIRQVRVLNNDLLKPRYRVTYVITSEKPKTVKVRYACRDEINEVEATLGKTMRYMIELLTRD
ncbi:hypothetical protein Vdis_0124 [Vulcanisaeta distributa DSM 14429]|uniref:Uncharacterized protein n=2 Tax=Vulcanisaeta distributa TaxID=164451 RepID=E1QSE4_VULDI|nr:hypothetical protein Vdis_0124 [Vulcanisaeta distributa DSM 14429]